MASTDSAVDTNSRLSANVICMDADLSPFFSKRAWCFAIEASSSVIGRSGRCPVCTTEKRGFLAGC